MPRSSSTGRYDAGGARRGTGAVVRQRGFQLPAPERPGTTDDFTMPGSLPSRHAQRMRVGRIRSRAEHAGCPGARDYRSSRGAPIWRIHAQGHRGVSRRRDFVVPADIRVRSGESGQRTAAPCPGDATGMEAPAQRQLSALAPFSVSDGRSRRILSWAASEGDPR